MFESGLLFCTEERIVLKYFGVAIYTKAFPVNVWYPFFNSQSDDNVMKEFASWKNCVCKF